MPRPITHAKTGVFHFNIRVPADLAVRLKSSRVTLPFDAAQVTVAVTDKVAFSLRTKDPAVAKGRFTPAHAALLRHFDLVRAGPGPLTHKQAVALAGEVYRERAARLEADAAMMPERLEADRREHDAAIAEFRFGHGDGLGELHGDQARFLAAIQRPSGAALLAWETKQDVCSPLVSLTYDEAMEALFGRDADAVCARRGVLADPASRRALLREIGEAVRHVGDKLARNIAGDYSPDAAAARFPAFEQPARTPAAASPAVRRQEGEGVAALYGRWKAENAHAKAQSTLRRYGPSLESLDSFAKGRPWRLLTSADVFAWANHRSKEEGVSAATVNRNDLVAVASVLGWATAVNGRKAPEANAAFGVKVLAPKKLVTRERMFREREIAEILRLARSVRLGGRHPRAAASRRWAPWLCAYSGARVQEVLWLRKSDIRKEEGSHVMCLPRTKDGYARTVPLHAALVKEGFLDFVRAAPEGWLFVGDRPAKEGASRSAQEMRAAELAAWVQSKVSLEDGVSPLHGWRHTWVTYAEAAGIPPRFSNRITGHNMSDVSGRYVGRRISLLAAEMDKFPVYRLD